jgi:hypothetical protein
VSILVVGALIFLALAGYTIFIRDVIDKTLSLLDVLRF